MKNNGAENKSRKNNRKKHDPKKHFTIHGVECINCNEFINYFSNVI